MDSSANAQTVTFIRECSKGQVRTSRSLQVSQPLSRPGKAKLVLGRVANDPINFHHSEGLEDACADAAATSSPFVPHEPVTHHTIPSPNRDQRQNSARGSVSTIDDTEITVSLSGPGPLPASSEYLSFVLNPSAANVLPQNPESVGEVRSGCASDIDHLVSSPPSPLPEPRLETNPEVAFLLRRFSDGPGKWYELAS